MYQLHAFGRAQGLSQGQNLTSNMGLIFLGEVIKPKRTSAGQRLYRKQDVERVLLIKHLLHEKRFTIKGAKRHLRTKGGRKPPTPSMLEEIRYELKAIRDLLTES